MNEVEEGYRLRKIRTGLLYELDMHLGGVFADCQFSRIMLFPEDQDYLGCSYPFKVLSFGCRC